MPNGTFLHLGDHLGSLVLAELQVGGRALDNDNPDRHAADQVGTHVVGGRFGRARRHVGWASSRLREAAQLLRQAWYSAVQSVPFKQMGDSWGKVV